jgi:uncharacterized spore protein YtfJ
MSEQVSSGFQAAERSFSRGKELLDRMLNVARTETVYSAPVTQGGYTIIQTSEAIAAVGFGYGMGSGEPSEENASAATLPSEGAQPAAGIVGGGGAGGGGYSAARPVAVIQLGPDGVRMQPVVDVTKVGIAMLTTLGTMFLMLGRMRRG